MPTCEVDDAKFFGLVGGQMASFGGSKIVTWISVPGDSSSFEIGIFDGDSGKDDGGNLNMRGGNWDTTTTEGIFTLYADPLKDGSGNTQVAAWHGNQDNMPNNSTFAYF